MCELSKYLGKRGVRPMRFPFLNVLCIGWLIPQTSFSRCTIASALMTFWGEAKKKKKKKVSVREFDFSIIPYI